MYKETKILIPDQGCHMKKRPVKNLFIVLFIALLSNGVNLHAQNPPSVNVRVANFTVPPSTGPVSHIIVKNLLTIPNQITVDLKLPQGWKWTPAQSKLLLEPEQLAYIPFTIEKAIDTKSNQYPVEVLIKDKDNRTISRKQTIACTSAPYFKPKIDGQLSDWSDAIPFTFDDNGKTIVRTYWNKKQFCLAVEVHEDKLTGYKNNPQTGTVDAVQFAISPPKTVTASTPEDKANRYEFLLTDCPGMFAKDKCFQLLKAGDPLSLTQQTRNLDTLEFKDAQVEVKRKGKITIYECAIPLSAMPNIQADVGREIGFSLLVHNAENGNIRDLGKAAGLWPTQTNKYAWSTWQGVKWQDKPQYDNKIEWGLCSSKH